MPHGQLATDETDARSCCVVIYAARGNLVMDNRNEQDKCVGHVPKTDS